MMMLRKPIHKLSLTEVSSIVQEHKTHQLRLNSLYDAYKNKGAIQNKQRENGKANNKLAHGFAYSITSEICGFMSKEPKFLCPLQQELAEVLKYNDSNAQNNQLLLDMSIFGVAVEQYWIDTNGRPRFQRISPMDIIVLNDLSVEENMWCVIKHWETGDYLNEEKIEYVEVYYRDEVERFSFAGEKYVGNKEIDINYIGEIPFTIIKNNQEMMADYERSLSLIDAYNVCQSNTLDAMCDITNALLVISGVSMSDEQLQQVKNMRTLADEGQVNATMIYNEVPVNMEYLNRLRQDIFSLSMCIDLTDESIGNLSGSALRQRLVQLHYLCSTKAGFIKRGYLRRVEMIFTIMKLSNQAIMDIAEIIANTSIEINYNTLEDNTELLALVNGLDGVVSKQTQLSFLGDKISSVEDEMALIEQEKEQNMARFSFMQDTNGHMEQEEETWDTGSKEDVDNDEEEQAE